MGASNANVISKQYKSKFVVSNVVFEYQIDLDPEKTKNDQIILTASGYSQTIKIESMKAVKGWIELRFGKSPPKGAKLTMTYHKGNTKESFIIFEDQAYDDMLQQAQQAADEFADYKQA